MELTLVRNKTGEDGTFGMLTWDGRSLVALEKPWNGGDNAPDKSCVAAGRYEVLINYSPHFERPTPILLGVPGRSEIRIHPANWQTQLLGCIAVGEFEAVINGVDGVAQSVKAFGELMADLNATKDLHNWITIHDYPLRAA